jgi:hypothetical protein
MGIREKLLATTAALMGISTHVPPTAQVTPTPQTVEAIRRANGGQLQRLPASRTRWYMSDLESATFMADVGDVSSAALLMKSARSDGVLAGVLSTRTGGLVRLPKRFRGPAEQIAALQVGHDSNVRSVFDEMFPPSELALLAADGVLLGVGVAELVPVEGRDFPVMVRLDPQFLRFQWNEGTWYFDSVAGRLRITPGDGRWILHTPGGRAQPWDGGLWKAIGKAFIRKEMAAAMKDAWEAKLANPARVATAPNGAVEEQREGFIEQVMAWGLNSVFSLTPGYSVELLESNGRGYESFEKTIATQNNEFIIAVCGQTVTVDGGTGFANADVHKSIRADLIKDTADSLAYTINTQGLPPFVLERWGEEGLQSCAAVEWDVTPPADQTREAVSLQTIATAIISLDEALGRFGRRLDIAAIATRFGIPIADDVNADGVPDKSEGLDEEDRLDTDDDGDRVVPIRRSREAA